MSKWTNNRQSMVVRLSWRVPIVSDKKRLAESEREREREEGREREEKIEKLKLE